MPKRPTFYESTNQSRRSRDRIEYLFPLYLHFIAAGSGSSGIGAAQIALLKQSLALSHSKRKQATAKPPTLHKSTSSPERRVSAKNIYSRLYHGSVYTVSF